MLTRRGASSLLAMVLFTLLSWLSANPAFTIASLSLILLFLLENARFVRSLKAIERLRVTRIISDPRLFVGRLTHVNLGIENVVGRDTGYLLIHDMVPHTFKVLAGSPSAIARIPARETLQIDYALEALQMGDHDIEGVGIVAQDPLGFSRHTLSIPVSSRIQVYPKIRPLSLLRARGVAQVRQASSIGARAITRSGLGSDFRGIREYYPGDEFKHIAWKVVAKSPRRDLMTKEFEADRSLNVVVAIHAKSSMLDGKVGARKLDCAVQALVALAYVCAHEGDRLVFVFDGRSQILTVPGQGRQRQIVQALFQTYNIKPSREESLAELAAAIRQHVRLRSLVFIVTDAELVDAKEIRDIAGLSAAGHQSFLYLVDTGALFEQPSSMDSRARMGYDVVRSVARQNRTWIRDASRFPDLQTRFCAPQELFGSVFQAYLSAKKRGVITV